MVLDPGKYLTTRCKAAKLGLIEILQKQGFEFFLETKSNYYNYLQGLRDMAFYLGHLDEEENGLWMYLFLDLYHCCTLEEIKAVPNQPPGLGPNRESFRDKRFKV
jgi:hypothetical protein